MLQIVFKAKISDLSVDIKETFSTELNTYVLDNSLLNKIFPLTIFAFCLFLLFIFFHWMFETLKIYESDLEMAKIEQHLIKYYSSDSALYRFFDKVLDFIEKPCSSRNDQSNEQIDATSSKGCCYYFKQIINWITWKWIYFVYKSITEKSKVDIALEKINLFLQEEKLRFESKRE